MRFLAILFSRTIFLFSEFLDVFNVFALFWCFFGFFGIFPNFPDFFVHSLYCTNKVWREKLLVFFRKFRSFKNFFKFCQDFTIFGVFSGFFDFFEFFQALSISWNFSGFFDFFDVFEVLFFQFSHCNDINSVSKFVIHIKESKLHKLSILSLVWIEIEQTVANKPFVFKIFIKIS